MKFDNILKYVLLLCVASGLYAQNFYTYKLFDDKLQAVFPANPEVVPIPKAYLDAIKKGIVLSKQENLTQNQIDRIANEIKKNIKAYQYMDNANQITYSLMSGPSYIATYRQKEKNKIDKTIKGIMRAEGRKFLKFSSKTSSSKNSYTAIFTTSFMQGGQKVYASTKRIYNAKYIYKWTMIYRDYSDKQIFDKYQDSVKVLR